MHPLTYTHTDTFQILKEGITVQQFGKTNCVTYSRVNSHVCSVSLYVCTYVRVRMHALVCERERWS